MVPRGNRRMEKLRSPVDLRVNAGFRVFFHLAIG